LNESSTSMTTNLADLLSLLTAYSLLLTIILLVSQRPITINKWIGTFFMACVVLYLVIELIPQSFIPYFLVGPFLVAFSFWMLSRSLFNDRPISVSRMVGGGLAVLILYYGLFFLGKSPACDYQGIVALTSRGISLIFVILAILEAQQGRFVDLVEKRRNLRTTFTYVVGVIVLLTLFGELGLTKDDQEIPKILQRGAILIFNIYFLVRNTTWKDDFFGASKLKQIVTNPNLINRINVKMHEDQLYRKEGLTIGQLAESLSEQEYKTRQTINQQMGYRNFTDFVNSFRIEEAKKIFADPDQRKVTILEIAYKVGFNSVGPFNRAFKSVTGQTPTEFRNDNN